MYKELLSSMTSITSRYEYPVYEPPFNLYKLASDAECHILRKMIPKAYRPIAPTLDGTYLRAAGAYCFHTHKITMAKFEYFYNMTAITYIFYHELVHSTGSHHLLRRLPCKAAITPEHRWYEEFVADMGAALLATHLGYSDVAKEATTHLGMVYKMYLDRFCPAVTMEQFTVMFHEAVKAVQLILKGEKP